MFPAPLLGGNVLRLGQPRSVALGRPCTFCPRSKDAPEVTNAGTPATQGEGGTWRTRKKRLESALTGAGSTKVPTLPVAMLVW